MKVYRLKENNKLLFLIGSMIIVLFFLKRIYEMDSIIIINDEFGYWGTAASLAGKNWKSLMATVPYYSFGYSLLLTPFYVFNISPNIAYKIAILYNIIFIIASLGISFLCCKNITKKNCGKLFWVICFVICFYTNNIVQVQLAWTESLLYFLSWLLFYLFIKNIKNLTYKNLSAGIFIAIYLLSVHQRTIGMIAIYLVMLFFYMIVSHKSYKYFVFAFLELILLLFIYWSIKENIMSHIYVGINTVNINGAAGQTGKIYSILHTKSGFLNFIESVIGKIYYISVSSFYIVPMAVCFMIKQSLQFINKFIKSKFKELDQNSYIFLFVLLAFFSLLMINAIYMFDNEGRLDYLIYGRYMEIMIGPVLLIGIIIIFQNTEIERFIFPYIVFTIISAYFVNIGLINSGSLEYNNACASTLSYYFQDVSQIPGIGYIIAILMGIPIIFYCLKKNKRMYYFTLFFITSVWIFLSDTAETYNLRDYVKRNVISVANKIEDKKNIKKLYYLDTENPQDEGRIYIKNIQFLIPDTEIIPIFSKGIESISPEKRNYIISDINARLPDNIREEYEIIITTKMFILYSRR